MRIIPLLESEYPNQDSLLQQTHSETSMEEILQSIREIIQAEDGDVQNRESNEDNDDSPLVLEDKISDGPPLDLKDRIDQDHRLPSDEPDDLVADEEVSILADPHGSGASNETSSYVSDLDMQLSEEPSFVRADNTDKDSAQISQQSSLGEIELHMLAAQADKAGQVSDDRSTKDDEGSLPVHPDVEKQVGRAFSKLKARALDKKSHNSHDDSSNMESEISLLVSNAIKPMLREWLNHNLPDIVERMVAEQIEKIVQSKR